MRLKVLFTLAAITCLMSLPAFADSEGIGWIPSWKQAIEEAARTHKPILLLSAAPQCGGVPGIW